MSKYSVIILIIASDNTDYYINMQKIWKLYMNTHPSIKSFFIKEKDTITNELELDHDTIYTKCKPSLIPGILIKTIKSIKYINDNYNFDYLFRTNLSSFIDLNKLYDFIQNKQFNYGAVQGIHNGIKFGSGCGFFLSKEASLYLLNQDINYNNGLYDDVEIGRVLSSYEFYNVNRIDFILFQEDLVDKIKKSNVFHFRCKNEFNMNVTIYNLVKMYELFYAI